MTEEKQSGIIGVLLVLFLLGLQAFIGSLLIVLFLLA